MYSALFPLILVWVPLDLSLGPLDISTNSFVPLQEFLRPLFTVNRIVTNFIRHLSVRRLQNALGNFLTTETFASGFNDLCYGTIIEKNNFLFIGSFFY